MSRRDGLAGDLADGFVDLVLGSSCVVCQRPGRALCATCRRDLPAAARVCWPTPTPEGLLPPYAAGAYADGLRAMVVAHKERRVLALTDPLGEVLATSVRAAIDATALDGATPVLLVPVPSRSASVRARGHDPTAAMARSAARRLGAALALPVVTAPLLRLRPGVADQSGLDTAERAANLAGAMATEPGRIRRLARRHPRARVVLCDDVLTTGATLREAQRTLESVGIRPFAAACVAATRRRTDGTG